MIKIKAFMSRVYVRYSSAVARRASTVLRQLRHGLILVVESMTYEYFNVYTKAFDVEPYLPMFYM